MADTAGRALGASSITAIIAIGDIKYLWFIFCLFYGIGYLLFMIISLLNIKNLDRLHYIKIVKNFDLDKATEMNYDQGKTFFFLNFRADV